MYFAILDDEGHVWEENLDESDCDAILYQLFYTYNITFTKVPCWS